MANQIVLTIAIFSWLFLDKSMYYVLCMYVCIEVYFDFVSEIVYAFTSVLLEKMKITTKKKMLKE